MRVTSRLIVSRPLVGGLQVYIDFKPDLTDKAWKAAREYVEKAVKHNAEMLKHEKGIKKLDKVRLSVAPALCLSVSVPACVCVCVSVSVPARVCVCVLCGLSMRVSVRVSASRCRLCV